jgi:hypothetical protein
MIEIDFSGAGNSRAYVSRGWSGAEHRHTWALDQASVLIVRGVPERGNLVARLRVWPFLSPPVLTVQRLSIAVNGVALAQFDVVKPDVLEFPIPTSAFREQGLLEFAFSHPDAARPADLSASAESRNLALAFVSLSLHVAPEQSWTDSDLPQFPNRSADQATAPVLEEPAIAQLSAPAIQRSPAPLLMTGATHRPATQATDQGIIAKLLSRLGFRGP